LGYFAHYQIKPIGTLPGNVQHHGRADAAFVRSADDGLAFEIHNFLRG
jgi:hypothetical protein